MPTILKKRKNQYVEHYEEHVGEEVAPYVALLEEEKTTRKENLPQQIADAMPAATPTGGNTKRRQKPFWRRVAAIFS